MPVKLGTVAPIGFKDFPDAVWLACLRDLGCTVVQAYRNPKAQPTVERMREAIAAGGMPCDSLHGIFGEEFDPSCPDEAARRRAVDTFKSEGELALGLGGPLVIVHCSTICTVLAQERALRVTQLGKSIVELGQFGKANGIRYAFENLPAYHPVGSDVAELAGILRELQAPNTGLCYDTGHANMNGDAIGPLDAAAGQLIYVHFSNNSGQADDHDMPSFGTIDAERLARKLHQIGYEGTLMLEVFYPVERMRELVQEGYAEDLRRIIAIANGAMP